MSVKKKTAGAVDIYPDTDTQNQLCPPQIFIFSDHSNKLYLNTVCDRKKKHRWYVACHLQHGSLAKLLSNDQFKLTIPPIKLYTE